MEARFEDLDHLPALVVLMAPSGDVEHVNRQVVEYVGVTLEQIKALGTNASVHPNDRSNVIETFRAASAAAQPYEVEHRLRRFDGEYRWFQARASPFRDPSGHIVRWYVLLTDVDDRRRAEQALRASEVQLRKIINALPTTAWSTRPDGYCDFLSHRWLDYAGFSAEKAEGWGWAEVIHPEDAPGLTQYWQACLAAGTPVDTEARMRGADGKYRWFLFRANPLRDDSGQIVKWYGTNIDVEDRKRADAALRASELNLRGLTETIPEMLWSATAEGAVDYCNSRFLTYTGFSAQEVMGDDWRRTIHPEDAARVAPIWMACVASGAPYDVEVRTLRSADRSYRWCTVSARPLLDEQKRILKWHGTAIDIHDRKSAEERLRQSEHDARQIVNSIPAQVAVLDPTGAVQQINPQMAAFLGKSAEQLDTWRTAEILAPEARPAVVAAMTHSLATGEPFLMENRLRRFDGVYRWFQVRGFPSRDSDGRLAHWYFALADIEERKQAEEALRQNEAFLAEGQRLSKTGTFYWNTDTNELRFSDENYRTNEIELGTPLTMELMASRIHPDDQGLIQEKIEAGLKNLGGLEYEIRLKMPSGEVKWVHTTARRYRNEDGTHAYIGAVRDVTERRHAEEAMSKLRSELTHLSRVSSLGALAASIAHEVNQPLAGMTINAMTCLRLLQAEPPNFTSVAETLRRLMRDANRASEIIARLRQMFSSKESPSEALQLNDIAQEVVALSLTELQRDALTVRAQYARDLPAIYGDRVQLQQVILNLLLNAADAMRGNEGGPREITLRTELQPDGNVRLTVADSGMGITPEHAEKLFEPFFTTKATGMGIGLSVSRSILERHRGRLWAEPNEGRGATFAFYLPCNPEVHG